MANFSTYINGETPVLVDFYADWCQPCKTMSRILEELKSRVGDRARIIKVNIDRNPKVTLTYRVKSVPTLILFRKGEIVWRWSGIVLADELQRVIQSVEQRRAPDYENHPH